MTIIKQDSRTSPLIKHLGSSQTNIFPKCQFMQAQYRYQLRWFKRVIGFGLTFFSLAKLVWNEREAIYISKCYEECLGSEILKNSDTILPENEGKLVYLTGYLDIQSPLQQHPYGVSISAVKLKRRVQMYQWLEERVSHVDDFDDNSYQYRMVWKDKLIDSSGFLDPEKHANPTNFPVTTEIRINPEVFLGAFTLSDELKEKFRDFTAFTSGERPEWSEIKMHMGLYYHSADIWNPSIGDLRVQFSFAGLAETHVSIIAKQVGEELQPFLMSSEHTIFYMHEGQTSHSDILHIEHYSKTYEIWWTRGTTLIMTFIGCLLTANTLLLLSRRNVVVKNFLEMVPCQFALILSLVLWLLVIGSVWITFKPILGLLLLTFACCFFLYSASFGTSLDHDNGNNTFDTPGTRTDHLSITDSHQIPQMKKIFST